MRLGQSVPAKPAPTRALKIYRAEGGMRTLAALALQIAASLVLSTPLCAQIQTVETTPQRSVWISHGRIEGHLALTYSAAGAFPPDSSTLAAVNQDKVVLMDLRSAGVRKVLRVHVPDVTDLVIQSANFIAPTRLFILGNGFMRSKESRIPAPTPLLAFQWDAEQDALSGKVSIVGAGGGFGAARYFPMIRYLGLYKDSNIDLWNPATGKGGRINIPALTRQPNLYEISPDGHWLLLAQIEASSTPDPVVVQLSSRQFVESLRGHQGTVLGMAVSRDDKKVATACEDGKVRIWSAPEWKLLQVLSGHQGPVHWAEFSADGNWVASAGEDKTVRIWQAESGKLEQTLEESQSPLVSVAFSPSDQYVAASAEQTVLIWERRRAE